MSTLNEITQKHKALSVLSGTGVDPRKELEIMQGVIDGFLYTDEDAAKEDYCSFFAKDIMKYIEMVEALTDSSWDTEKDKDMRAICNKAKKMLPTLAEMAEYII